MDITCAKVSYELSQRYYIHQGQYRTTKGSMKLIPHGGLKAETRHILLQGFKDPVQKPALPFLDIHTPILTGLRLSTFILLEHKY